MPYTRYTPSVKPARLPAPNRHITGRGHYRIPQNNS